MPKRVMIPPNLESWSAPAKLNLFLHVTGRRPDGYHTLQTLFQFLDFADELAFEVTGDRRISRATAIPGVAEDADLCVRAARALQAATGVRRGAAIHIVKRIPQGGGLGGGSSDAAATLLALNRLWKLALPLADLSALGLRLGADVPVFIQGHAAWGEGVGEVLAPVALAESWYVILVPPVRVSTQAVFAEFDRQVAAQLTGYSQPITIRDFHAGRVRNDLEAVVRRLYPEVDKALTWLGNFGDARMTGSGSCVYLTTTGPGQAGDIAGRCPRDCAKGFIARGINEHPIRRRYGDV
ncbi:MAG: 4-(cytidine 5'-diphospho)-2-C-methyl-D-erythritol kinase [Acidiferrobacterales bacterium]